jgi:hypothetical protein
VVTCACGAAVAPKKCVAGARAQQAPGKTFPEVVELKQRLSRLIRPQQRFRQFIKVYSRGRILSGPFAGVRYPDLAFGSAYISKLLGTYEKELSAVVAAQFSKHERLINIGSGEGYYCFGFLKRNPSGAVIAYEDNEDAVEIMKRYARINGFDKRIEARGRCEPADLRRDLQSSEAVLIFCDAEGYEDILLDPASVPELRRRTIIVETHDFILPGITAGMARRFAGSHSCEDIPTASRTIDDFPLWPRFVRRCTAKYLTALLDEGRPAPMHWLILQPKAEGE